MFFVKISFTKFTTSSWKFTLPLPPGNLSVTTAVINVQISLVWCPPPTLLCDIDPTNWYYCDLIRVPHTSLENQHFQGWVPPPPLNTLKPRPPWWSGPPDTEEEISQQVFISSVLFVFLTLHSSLWSRASKYNKCEALLDLSRNVIEIKETGITTI